MANVKITDLNQDTAPASTDVLPFVDISSDETKKVTVEDLLESAGDGAAATPAFSFDSDKNTGIYRPGADQVAISTGGTGRLFIDSSGNVGVGTSSPSRLLDINDSSHATLALTSGTSGQSSIFFADTDTNVGQIAYFHNVNSMTFRVNDGERMRIDSSGRLGVGTSSPSTIFHLNTATGNNLQAFSLADSVKAYIGLSAATNSPLIGAAVNDLCFRSENANIKFGTASSTRTDLTIDSSGNVGIGTTSPSTLLELSENQGTTITLRRNSSAAVADDLIGKINFFNNDSSSPGARVTATVGAYAQSTAGGTYLAFSTATNGGSNAERLRIDSSGNVGVGTTSPSNPLVVKESSNICIELLKSTDASILTIGEDGSSGALFNAPNGAMVFEEGGSEAMRVDGSGRLLVGASTTAINAKLQVNGSIAWADNNNSNYTQPSISGLANGATTTFDIEIPTGTNAFQVTLAASANGGDRIGGVVACLYTSRYASTVRRSLHTINNHNFSFSANSLSGTTLTITVTNSSGYTGYQGDVRIIRLR